MDHIEFLSGIFEGKTTGAPIGFIINNQNTQSKDYQKEIFRPSHADFTYFHKYHHFDFRGGGRSSARETLVRVIASGIVAPLLQDITVESGVYAIGELQAAQCDFDYAKKSEIFALDPKLESLQKHYLQEIKNQDDSIGGIVQVRAKGQLLGLGEPLYYKLDSELARAMMGINGVKAVEIGEGIKASVMKGSEYNDWISSNGFRTNHSGGILGGIGTGEEIRLTIYFKPTPSISLPQQTINRALEECEISIQGRHDPCIAIRGCVVAEAMMKLVLADMLLLQTRFKG